MFNYLVLFSCFACALMSIESSAQETAPQAKTFVLYTGLGYAPSDGPNESYRIYLDVEPSIKLKPDLSVGIRLEHWAMSATSTPVLNPKTIHVLPQGSIAVTTQYYITGEFMRLFAGAGIGIYGIKDFPTSSQDFGNTMNPGCFVRAGLEFGRVFVLTEFNFIANKYISDWDLTQQQSYWNFRAGVRMFDRKK